MCVIWIYDYCRKKSSPKNLHLIKHHPNYQDYWKFSHLSVTFSTVKTFSAPSQWISLETKCNFPSQTIKQINNSGLQHNFGRDFPCSLQESVLKKKLQLKTKTQENEGKLWGVIPEEAVPKAKLNCLRDIKPTFQSTSFERSWTDRLMRLIIKLCCVCVRALGMVWHKHIKTFKYNR